MKKKVLLGLIGMLLIFSVSTVYGLAPPFISTNNIQNEQTKLLQDNTNINQQTTTIDQSKNKISKKQAINIALRQLESLKHPELFSIKVLGLIKIDRRTAWKISCKWKESPTNCIVYVNAKTGQSKKNKKIAHDERGELLWRYISEVTISDAAAKLTQEQNRSPYLKRPSKIMIHGQTIWRVPTYHKIHDKLKFNCYVYVNLKKKIAKRSDSPEWWTFKELGIE